MSPIVKTTLVVGALYTFDAWVVGQGGFMLLAALVGMGFALVRAAAAAVRRQGSGVALHAGTIVIWILGAVGTFASINYQARVAKRRGDEVVAACKQFHAARGVYPTSLDELVPTYLASVPRAKYTVLFGSFIYRTARPEQPDNGPTLSFVVMAPFMRTTYVFQRDEWITLD